MLHSLMSSFPALSGSDELNLVDALDQWSLSNGLIMYPPQFTSHSANAAPVTIFPTPFPESAFKDAFLVQEPFNQLYANVVLKNLLWLLAVLEQLSQSDPDFTGKLFNVYKSAIASNKSGKLTQPVLMGLFRSDYMVDTKGSTPVIKQIEFNTVLISFGALSTKVSQLHSYLNNAGYYQQDTSIPYYNECSIPISDSLQKLSAGLAVAHAHYENAHATSQCAILFLVQENERNIFDQRHLEYALLSEHKIKSVRSTLGQVSSRLITKEDRLYIKATGQEVALVYYRSGYAPADYESDQAATWKARLVLEQSLAIKCPLILVQLAGSKKIQQLLTEPSAIKSRLPDLSTDEHDRLLNTFVAIYPLDDSERGKEAKRLAFESPQDYVLKPQREGGGNNVYKTDIPSFLQKIDEKEWDAYILMELIKPPTFKNKVLRNDQVFNEDIISELGIFGTILFNEDSGKIFSNETAGFLLRSKFEASDEGGVAAGFGCLDSVELYREK